MLCSIIKNEMQSYRESSAGSSLACFYFDFQDERKQQSVNLIRWIPSQFIIATPIVPDRLQTLFGECQRGKQQPSYEDLTHGLRNMISDHPQLHVAIDALMNRRTGKIFLLFLASGVIGN